MIQTLLDKLESTWDFEPPEINHIQELMVTLAIAACLDSKIREQCFKLAEKKD